MGKNYTLCSANTRMGFVRHQSATEGRRKEGQNLGGESRKVNASFGNQEFHCQQRGEGT